MPTRPDPIRSRLAQALPPALKQRDRVAVAAIRGTLAAIANAEAVEAPGAEGLTASPHVAGSAAGLGAAEARRRDLTESDVRTIVVQEAAEREAAAAVFEQAGEADRASRLRAEAAVLRRFTV